MYCTNCLGQVHEIGGDCSSDHEEIQYAECPCNRISSIVFPFTGGVIFVGLVPTPTEKALYGNIEVD